MEIPDPTPEQMKAVDMDQKLFDAFDKIEQAMVPADLKAKRWRYQDFNTVFSPDAWDYLLRLIGEGEYQIITMTRGVKKGEPFVRGQLFISPQGFANMGDKQRRDATPFDQPQPNAL